MLWFERGERKSKDDGEQTEQGFEGQRAGRLRENRRPSADVDKLLIKIGLLKCHAMHFARHTYLKLSNNIRWMAPAKPVYLLSPRARTRLWYSERLYPQSSRGGAWSGTESEHGSRGKHHWTLLSLEESRIKAERSSFCSKRRDNSVGSREIRRDIGIPPALLYPSQYESVTFFDSCCNHSEFPGRRL